MTLPAHCFKHATTSAIICSAVLLSVLTHSSRAPGAHRNGATGPVRTVAFASTAPALDLTENAIARTVLLTMNAERALHGLPALRMNGNLIKSAHAHNLRMARFNTMSHQLPGEAFLAVRISRTGYTWRMAGENVAWNTDRTTRGALYLERLMYGERAPNDGHRRNILSGSFRHVGIDILIDARTHKLWMTQDFGRPL